MFYRSGPLFLLLAPHPSRIPQKIDAQIAYKSAILGLLGCPGGDLERPGPPGGGVPTLFGRILGIPGAPWGRLGASWGRLGAPREPLGRSWGRLGLVLGRPEAFLGGLGRV